MKTVVFWLAMVTMVATAFGRDIGVYGGYFRPNSGSFTVLGTDSVRFTLITSPSRSIGLHAWFDDATGAGDTVYAFYRTLADENWSTLPVGSPFIPIPFLTDESPWTSETELVFVDSAVYSACVPDSLLGLGLEPFAPVTCGAIEFMFKTATGDTVDVHWDIQFK